MNFHKENINEVFPYKDITMNARTISFIISEFKFSIEFYGVVYLALKLC